MVKNSSLAFFDTVRIWRLFAPHLYYISISSYGYVALSERGIFYQLRIEQHNAIEGTNLVCNCGREYKKASSNTLCYLRVRQNLFKAKDMRVFNDGYSAKHELDEKLSNIIIEDY